MVHLHLAVQCRHRHQKDQKISTARESVEVGGDAEPKPMTRSKISVLRAKTVDGVSAGRPRLSSFALVCQHLLANFFFAPRLSIFP